jgi:Nodulation protein S (NodS)
MERSASTLVLVAHPGDETLAFSTVCPGADVVSVTDGSWSGFTEEFSGACHRLGAKRAFSLSLPNIDPWRLPKEVLVARLKALGPYSRIYTHSPLEQHSHHRDVALAASQCFEEIWVRDCGGYSVEVYVLSQSAFRQKLKIINQMYAPRLAAAAEDEPFCGAELTGVEAFVPTRFSEVSQALAHISPGIRLEVPDLWAFETSPYEQERYDQTCSVLAHIVREGALASILEIGACEGTMTQRLRILFPDAKITAVEVNPVFARRLRARLDHDPHIDIIEASVQEIPLSADLVCLAEILYLIPDHYMDLLERLKARYLLTSYIGDFDDRVSVCLQRYGWRNIATEQVLPRFEPVDGRASFLVIRRPGSYVRLWQLV